MESNLWSEYRLGKGQQPTSGDANQKADHVREEHRSAFQRDFDRLLFSSPVRRLADKTQVFPLEPNDSVRTRLTHSHEVSNLARSLGARLHHKGFRFGSDDIGITEVLAILQSVGLAHDIGNPPFGHQGEASISNWFTANEAVTAKLPPHTRNEFLDFEGNAQTIRILTRLQHGVGDHGLDLTCATLASLIKYPVNCNNTGDRPESKKYGYFFSEKETVESIFSRTGLSDSRRHPLVWIMEAADDIAYSVLDVEDAIKKGIISPEDVYFTLKSDVRDNCGNVCISLKGDFKRVASRVPKVSVAAAREIKASYLRTRLIDQLVEEAVDSYITQAPAIFEGGKVEGLLDNSLLCKRLKRIARDYAFSSVGVTQIEANGALAITGLMTFFWNAITLRAEEERLDSRRSEAAAYGWSLLSDNYKEVAISSFASASTEMRPYYECRLLTDMMAGITDGFTMSLYGTLRSEGHI